ncbi:formylglycine-generating enzyme family protein [Luteimonas sp. 3794]|uniref:formylglycine-generating enzyme family protein n=1 Tax=Luteimonas sp. 3794 TaxID=2817730 RepID=UPI00285865B0|nr:formylglycine-generating enzyme family protein [Luteimonas sp. 3794]MDR6990991.1 formylglycine-generating enzyme required for sulfatase activity [Luteimonas sp. 3794]
MRSLFVVSLLGVLVLAGCKGEPADSDPAAGDGTVTISGDDAVVPELNWTPPATVIEAGAEADALEQARLALAADDLYATPASAIPLYLALAQRPGSERAARTGLRRAQARLLGLGAQALREADDLDSIAGLRAAHDFAAVARYLAAGDDAVVRYLERVDESDRLWELNRAAERALQAGELGEAGGGALALFREAAELRPGHPRALQGMAAVESAMIRRAEVAADGADYREATRWLAHAAKIRPGFHTVSDAGQRLQLRRAAHIRRLRDEGVEALPAMNGVAVARERLAQIIGIAEPGDPVVNDLRERIDRHVHYGDFRPGQVFTDALEGGARGPQVVVLPHGGFMMGALPGDEDAEDNESPRHGVRFERGFAMGVREVSVGEFRRFVDATGYQPRAVRRGFSMAYDERTGNFLRRSNVDWRSDYVGRPAGDTMPVLHVSAKDAQAYVDWLSAQSGRRYRLPSEAEFEYAYRNGTAERYPWGEGTPPEGAGNMTGALDRSPSGRRWGNAFPEYGDGYWGPAPVGSFTPNTWGVHDLAGNVSEWMADCWHENYRRAPKDGSAWVNPGCRNQVIRGGSWASSPAQTRTSWRALAQVDTTNARLGFRVVREL